MAKAKKNKSLKCDICGQTFAMPAHLGRHKAATHGVKSKAAKKKGGSRGAGVAGRKRAGRRPGRPSAIATRFGLGNLSLDELASLVEAARGEMEIRIRDFEEMLS